MAGTLTGNLAVTSLGRLTGSSTGSLTGMGSAGPAHEEARHGTGEAAVVLQGFFHAAALTGRGIDEVLTWAADPLAATTPAQVLGGHPHAAPLWNTLLHGALHGPERLVAAAVAALQQALSVLYHEPVRRRLLPGPGRPATDLAAIIASGGTICLLGRDDPYASASPLLTALTEDLLDAASATAKASPWGRLCPPMLACLDDLPATVPLPTLRARMTRDSREFRTSQESQQACAGVALVWTARSQDQLTAVFGEAEARTVVGLTDTLAVLGEVPDRHASVVAESGRPVLVRLARCLDGAAGRTLLAERDRLRDRARESLERGERRRVSPAARGTAAVVAAHRRGLTGTQSQPIPGPAVPGPTVPVRAPAAGPAPEVAPGPPRLLLIDGGIDEED